MTAIMGWDVGGANLKAVLIRPGNPSRTLRSWHLPCALWRGEENLVEAMRLVSDSIPPEPLWHALTMSGELVDHFEQRRAGVVGILSVFRSVLPMDHAAVYAGSKGWIDLRPQKLPRLDGRALMQIASANWHATATMVAALLPRALLVDVGSTTTDVIALRGGKVLARGRDDHGRLISGELVYQGATRTPLMTLGPHIDIGKQRIGLMSEHFATMADVRRVLGDPIEAWDLHPTADGRPKTVPASRARIARMIGLDAGDRRAAWWTAVARAFAHRQEERIADAIVRVGKQAGLPAKAPVVAVGSGDFIAHRAAALAGRSSIGLASLVEEACAKAGVAAPPARLSQCLSAAAPAFAVAWHLWQRSLEAR